MSSTLEDAGKTVELDQARVGRLSRMDAMQNQQMALETERRRKEKIQAVDKALQRIGSGRFGICVECDELINPRRLEVEPTHILCIDCASKTT